ncbi:MAG: helix-turn-helix domain-containing protein [Firmicutes bacterium]|nr:helix-turn-helix domain-containing protein [Bacillota bacterium]
MPESRYPYEYLGTTLEGLKVGFAKRSDSYTMPVEHFHNYYEIYYLREGSRYFFIRDNTYYIKAGELVLVDRREMHRTLETLEKYHDRVVFDVYENLIEEPQGQFAALLHELFKDGSRILSFTGADKDYVDSLMGRIYNEISQRRAGYELMVRVYVLQILVFANRNMTRLSKDAEESLRHANKRIFEVLNYINTHYMESLKLEAVAQQFFINKYYLSHTFKEVTGFTFTEYLSNVRIKEAERLLVKTDTPVTEIAGMLGFQSVTHFGRVFHKVAGTSPLNYRRDEARRRSEGYMTYHKGEVSSEPEENARERDTWGRGWEDRPKEAAEDRAGMTKEETK